MFLFFTLRDNENGQFKWIGNQKNQPGMHFLMYSAPFWMYSSEDFTRWIAIWMDFGQLCKKKSAGSLEATGVSETLRNLSQSICHVFLNRNDTPTFFSTHFFFIEKYDFENEKIFFRVFFRIFQNQKSNEKIWFSFSPPKKIKIPKK